MGNQDHLQNLPWKVCQLLWLGDGLCLCLCGVLHDRKRVVYLLIVFCSGHPWTRMWRGLKARAVWPDQIGQ